MRVHSFKFQVYLLSTYYVPGIVLYPEELHFSGVGEKGGREGGREWEGRRKGRRKGGSETINKLRK